MNFTDRANRILKLTEKTAGPGAGIDVLLLFHHTHHEDGEHKVHHCGGDHPNSNYRVEHCPCGKHWIDRQDSVGHGVMGEELRIHFVERCPKMKEKVWHVESGVLPSQQMVDKH